MIPQFGIFFSAKIVYMLTLYFSCRIIRIQKVVLLQDLKTFIRNSLEILIINFRSSLIVVHFSKYKSGTVECSKKKYLGTVQLQRVSVYSST